MFTDFHRTCDNVYWQLHANGIGTTTSHTESFTTEEQDHLLTSGIFSFENLISLQRAVFFYVGKHFCVRGGEE
jgi:hypothetical protein